MMISIQVNNQTFQINPENQLSIAIPMRFNGAQPNAWDVEKAISKPCEAGTLVGDTRRGGSVNFEQVKFIPHCNGTHTECVGHITHQRISVHDCLCDAFSIATLISVSPEKASETRETYAVKLNDDDLLITRAKILEAVSGLGFENSESGPKSQIQNPKSLIVRTLPNTEDKLRKTYLAGIPPFFSTEAMEFIAELQINHLLVDTPSIDRIFDEGKLPNHRIFWNVVPGAFEINEQTLTRNTVTELIFVPDAVKDGSYLLNLQIAPFEADAAPSRPVLFQMIWDL